MANKKSKFYTFIKKVVSILYGKRRFIELEKIPDEASVIVANHAQLHGPLFVELYFQKPKKIWCIDKMMNKDEVSSYALDDFFKYKSKRSKWFYKIISHIISRPFSFILNNTDTIPVYKDVRLISTLKTSVNSLDKGEHLVIFPEKHKPHNEIINDFQENFVDVARLYYKRTGKILNFVPMYVCPKLKSAYLSEAIKYNPYLSPEENRNKVKQYCMEQITYIARSLPKHTVIPYANVSKRKYQKSKI